MYHSNVQNEVRIFLCLVLPVVLLTASFDFLTAQCTNTELFPAENIMASQFSDTVVVTTQQQAGQYYVIENLEVGKTYSFFSSNTTDFITVRDQDGINALAFGTTPVQYTITGDDIVTVHINLTVGCGTEAVDRTTSAVCTDCPDIPPAIGIQTNTPKARLDVNGEIKVGDVVNPPVAGVIRWNPEKQDFEGYDGTKWKSFTKSLSSWGTVPSNLGQENQRLLGETGGNVSDRFGQAVSISGNYAVVGAINGDQTENGNEGSVYVFRMEGSSWVEDTVLYASDGGGGDRFGGSVDIDGDYIVIGAESNDAGGSLNRGAAYVFKRSGNTWTEQQKLTASDGANFDVFGESVAISGDRIIVGADGADPNNQGAAYVYKRNGGTWTEEDILTAQDAGSEDRFGFSVDLDGRYAVVGAYLDDVGGVVNQGSAYVFYRTGSVWAQQEKLTASDGDAEDRFGVSVAISDSSVVVGADQYNILSQPDIEEGAAYVFTGNAGTWNEQTILRAPQGVNSDAFGSAVDISGDYILVGAFNRDLNGNLNQGAAYFFELSEGIWKQTTQLVASDGNASDFFGTAVAVSGNCALVGADNNAIGSSSQQGAAYFFFK